MVLSSSASMQKKINHTADGIALIQLPVNQYLFLIEPQIEDGMRAVWNNGQLTRPAVQYIYIRVVNNVPTPYCMCHARCMRR